MARVFQRPQAQLQKGFVGLLLDLYIRFIWLYKVYRVYIIRSICGACMGMVKKLLQAQV